MTTTATSHVFSDESKFLPGGKWSCHAADVKKNFPACIMLLHQDDVETGDAVWIPRVGDFKFNAESTFLKNELGVSEVAATTSDNITDGELPAIGTGYPAFLWQGNARNTSGGGEVQLGAPALRDGISLNIRASTIMYLAPSSTNYVGVAGLTGAAFPFEGCATIYGDVDSSTLRGQAYLYGTTLDASQNIGPINKSGVDGGTGIDLSGGEWPKPTDARIQIVSSDVSGVKVLALFSFANEQTPVDIQAANIWMAANPGKLYPGWAGKV